MTDIVLEIIRTCILFGIVCYLWKAGREHAELFRGGWKLILGGFILLLFTSLLDITDNFETLNKIEKIVGYLGGFLLVSIGLARWIQTVSTVKKTRALPVKLKAIKEALQREFAWRMTSEKAIDVAKKKLEEIMESMIDGVTVIDMKGRIITINRATTEQHGYTKEEVIGKTPGEIFIDKKDNPKFLEALRRMASGETIRGEGYLAKRKDGTNFRASVNLSLIRDAKGKPVAITAVHRDVTESKKAEEALNKTTLDLKERVKELNCLYGLSKLVENPDISLEELFQEMANLIPPACQYPDIICGRIVFKDKEFKTANFKATKWKLSTDIMLQGKKAGSVEVYYLEEKPQIDKGPFSKEERKLIDAIAERLGRIAESKKAEEALQESERKYRELVKTSIDGVVSTDEQMKIILWNLGAERIFGYSEREILGQSLMKIVPERYRKKQEEGFVGFRRTGTGPIIGKTLELEGLRKDGTEVPIELSVSARKSDETYIATAIVRDVTERKLAEEELQKTMAMKTQIISTVSHELRTPLAAIKEGINIISDGIAGKTTGAQKEFLDIAKRNVTRLARFIEGVLNFQKFEFGKVEFDMRENDINETVMEAYRTMAITAKKKGLNFKIELDNTLPKVRFDKDKIIQVITNIIGNAVKYTKGGSITITTDRWDNAIKVSVQDTGIGIKKEDILKLFQPFTQISRGKDRKASGTGLGLAISKGFIDAHKGKIWAESKIGKGTTLHFALPIKERRE